MRISLFDKMTNSLDTEKADLISVKSQIEMMLKSISSLDLGDRTEALDFLKDCAMEFGLVIPEQKLFSTETEISSIIDISNDALSYCKNENEIQDNQLTVEYLSASEFGKNQITTRDLGFDDSTIESSCQKNEDLLEAINIELAKSVVAEELAQSVAKGLTKDVNVESIAKTITEDDLIQNVNKKNLAKSLSSGNLGENAIVKELTQDMARESEQYAKSVTKENFSSNVSKTENFLDWENKKRSNNRRKKQKLLKISNVKYTLNDVSTKESCFTNLGNLNALGEIDKRVSGKELSSEKCNIVNTFGGNESPIENLKCPGCMASCETKALLFQHFTTHDKSPMSCRLCRSNFSNMLHLWRHKKKKQCHLSLLKCSECGEKFKYRRHYLKHILGHNDNNCRYCNEKFSTWVLYKQHLKEKHPDIKTERDLIPCKFCAMSFRRHLSLYNHYQTEHSKGKFVCLSCGLLLPTKEKFKEHTMIHESEKMWKCKICKMKFYRRQQLLYHISVHNSGTYKCLTCEITVTSKATLNKHKKQGHEVKGLEPKFECEICHKTFKKRVVLNNHMATHSKERKYYCKSCVKSFRTLDALQKHRKRKSHFEKAKIILPESKYEKIYEDKLICESCGKQYKTQRELTWHRRVHKNTYSCEECGKTFTLKVNLTKHKRLHKNKVCVVCELCGKTFSQLSALNEHILMKHSNIRNVECEVCKKKFKRNSELNRHMRIHEHKRPFTCFCGIAFKQSGHLQTHFKTLHQKNQSEDETELESFSNPPAEIYNEAIVNDQKQIFVNDDQNALLTLGNIEANYRNSNSYDTLPVTNTLAVTDTIPVSNTMPVTDSMPVNDNLQGSSYSLRYPQGGMNPINYELDFEASQVDKQELVFTSPAIDLSMVTIPEVVGNDISLGGSRDLPDDDSNLQLVNLSEHIVQEYLLNLP